MFKSFLENKQHEELALKFAEEKHAGQKRKFTGEPYIVHPKQVADLVKKFGGDSIMIQAAYLHDVLEDTNTTFEELEDNFGSMIAYLVKELTNDFNKLKELGKTNYLVQKMNKMSSNALIIKLADRLSNVSDFDTADLKWAKKYSKQTEEILNQLKHLNPTHERIIKEIRSKLI